MKKDLPANQKKTSHPPLGCGEERVERGIRKRKTGRGQAGRKGGCGDRSTVGEDSAGKPEKKKKAWPCKKQSKN